MAKKFGTYGVLGAIVAFALVAAVPARALTAAEVQEAKLKKEQEEAEAFKKRLEEARKKREEDAKKKKEKQQQQSQGGGASQQPAAQASRPNPPGGFNSCDGFLRSGVKCTGSAPADALQKAMDYFQTNSSLITSGQFTQNRAEAGRKIVINDYTSMPTTMYVYDEFGNCLAQTQVGFGKADGGSATPKAGCSSGGNATPPGFHITTENVGGEKYPFPSGYGLVSCEGQNSIARGVKIHPVDYEVGTRGNTLGCPAISSADYEGIMNQCVRGGSLVYNHFSPSEAASAEGCSGAGSAMGASTCNASDIPGAISGGSGGRSRARGTAQ